MNYPSMLRLAMLGQGPLADSVRSLVCRLENAELVVESTDSLDELLADHGASFDALVVTDCITSGDCQRLLDAEKHLLLAGPFDCLSDLDSDWLQSLPSDRVVMPGNELRFLPAARTIRQSLDDGQLGEPGLLRIHRWLPRADTAIEELPSLMVDEIDVARWLFSGSPTTIYAVGSPGFCQLHLGFADGGMAILDYAASLPADDKYFSISLIGASGAAYADDHHNMHLHYGEGGPRAVHGEAGNLHRLALLREFVDAVQQRRAPLMTPADALASIEIAAAAATSMKAGRAVHRTGDGYEPV